jgi:gamma-glutamylcyclotransferase
MLYFAYGSNMCKGRLRQRVPSANPVRIAKLLNHSFRLHKRSEKDGSGKADAYFTGNPSDLIWGVLFEVDAAEKRVLDRVEGLGRGYKVAEVTVLDSDQKGHRAFLYVAEQSHIDPNLKPYSWYKRFVVEGARQHELPADYVVQLVSMETIEVPGMVLTRNRTL